MMNEDRIREEVEKTLRSFDDEPALAENPFLLTRIEAEIARGSSSRGLGVFVLSNLKFAGIVALFLINIFTALYFELQADPDLHAKAVAELRDDLQIDQSQTNF
jgi:hypothetical protein